MEGIIPPPRSAAEKQARRRLAVPTVLDGWSQAEGADFLGLHPVTVAKWMATATAPVAKPASTPSPPLGDPASGRATRSGKSSPGGTASPPNSAP